MKKRVRVLFCLFLIMFFCVFLIISYFSTRYSLYLRDYDYQAGFVRYKDSVVFHFLSFLAFLGSGIFLSFLNLRTSGRVKEFLKIFVVIVSFSFCIFWVLFGNFYPINDTNTVLSCAENIRNGEYGDLVPSGYVGTYTQQLGLISILNSLFFIFCSSNYKIYQLLNCCCIPAIVLMGDSIVEMIFDSIDEDNKWRDYYSIFFLISIVWCLPLFFYTPYVYGEVLSATMVVAFVYLSFKIFNNFSWKYVFLMCIVSVIGFFARSNYAIILIAGFIVFLFQTFAKKRIRYIISVVVVCIVVIFSSKINVRYYEKISGVSINQGVPPEAWIAMGLNEYEGTTYGWYGGYNRRTYVESGCDKQKTRELSLLYIKDRLSMFVGNVGTSEYDFYKEKFLSQWNDPTMNCLIETKVHIPDTIDLISGTTNPDGKFFPYAVGIMNEHQYLVHLGSLIASILLLFKGKKFHIILPLIYVFGGILFTLLWEAMGRYVFPYYILLQVVSPIGWGGIGVFGCKLIQKFRLNRNK